MDGGSLKSGAMRGEEDAEMKGGRFEVSENQMIVIRLDGSKGRLYDLRIHPGGVKGAIDLRVAGTFMDGIYKLDGDTLTMCFPKEGQARPSRLNNRRKRFSSR